MKQIFLKKIKLKLSTKLEATLLNYDILGNEKILAKVQVLTLKAKMRDWTCFMFVL